MMNGDQFTSAAVSDRGLSESRPQNEDSYLELQQHGLFVVADGVGGAQAGEVASQMAVEIIGEAFINIGDSDPEDTMRIAIERANGAIFQMSQDLPQLASMATTLVVLHISGDLATVAHVGDSRIYRVDAGGRLFRETDDHSVVEEEVRAGRMTPEQALVHPSRNVISRALGAEDTVDPEIKMLIVHPATTFLLCSDGITRHIVDSEIEGLLASSSEPAEICAKMKEICFERGAEDNLTAVIVRFAGEKETAAEESDPESEQVTISTARPPFDSVVETDGAEEIYGDTLNMPGEVEAADVQELDIPDPEPQIAADENDDGAYLLENPDEIYADEPAEAAAESYTSSSVIVPAQEEVTADPAPSRSVSSYDYAPDEERAGFLGKAASTIGLLIVGTLIGLTAAYFLFGKYLTPVVEAPVLTEQKSNNVPLTSFEETRRLVDADPVVYLNANAASAQEADDYFWLGRALLLTGKPVEAKNQFLQAKNRLSQVDPKNAKTMASEIAMAMAIIDSPQASQGFAKEISDVSASSATDANANSSLNSVRPIR